MPRRAGAKAGCRPHPREEIEEDLGKAQVSPLLGNDEIAGQGRFETTAECVPLHQGDRRDGAVKVADVRVEGIQALLAIGQEPASVPIEDTAPEQGEIATEVVDPRYRGGGHVIADSHLEILGAHLGAPGIQVIQEGIRETGPGGPIHIAPGDFVLFVDGNGEFRVSVQVAVKGADGRGGSHGCLLAKVMVLQPALPSQRRNSGHALGERGSDYRSDDASISLEVALPWVAMRGMSAGVRTAGRWHRGR